VTLRPRAARAAVHARARAGAGAAPRFEPSRPSLRRPQQLPPLRAAGGAGAAPDADAALLDAAAAEAEAALGEEEETGWRPTMLPDPRLMPTEDDFLTLTEDGAAVRLATLRARAQQTPAWRGAPGLEG
jgi:hypothetical protein